MSEQTKAWIAVNAFFPGSIVVLFTLRHYLFEEIAATYPNASAAAAVLAALLLSYAFAWRFYPTFFDNLPGRRRQ